jgi:hypothetical protein
MASGRIGKNPAALVSTPTCRGATPQLPAAPQSPATYAGRYSTTRHALHYYAALWATVRWPLSLKDPDALFLIPADSGPLVFAGLVSAPGQRPRRRRRPDHRRHTEETPMSGCTSMPRPLTGF